jgi:hypothetical protein
LSAAREARQARLCDRSTASCSALLLASRHIQVDQCGLVLGRLLSFVGIEPID